MLKSLPYTSPLKLFSYLIQYHPYLYLLESVEGPTKLAEYSFIGFDPSLRIHLKEGQAFTTKDDFSEEYSIGSQDPLAIIRDQVPAPTPYPKFRLTGGAVGYISYDAIRYWEHLPKTARDEYHFPDIEMGIFNDGIVFDHINHQAYYYSLPGVNRYEEVDKAVRHAGSPPGDPERLKFSHPHSNLQKNEFEDAVRKTKHYITEGDIFQAVLSKRYTLQFEGSLLGFYIALREINPSPYMYFLKFGERQVVGSSPEMLVRVEKRTVETYPIAGTCPKVDDPVENATLARHLLADPKERAEHVMLVDLARNDVGRVSEYGSVGVPDYMTVHEYSHVQHIVSRVVGRLSSGKDSFDALRAMLPAGTVSGAPKVRAMEIIEELEPVRRGPYAGAVGYFSYNGNSDFAITIRTLAASGDNAYIQVGAGVVADSDPTREWVETERKAEALFTALNHAGEEM